MNFPLFLSTFALIFVAELPDKTAFATLLLASRGRAIAVFTGVALAFLIQTIVATLFGSVIALAPERWVHLGAGLMFLGFAAHGFFAKDDHDALGAKSSAGEQGFWRCTWQSFLVIFIAEWGDLTQLATASLTARYHDNKMIIFFAALLALWTVTLLAVFLGQRLGAWIPAERLKKIGAVLFALIGLYFIMTAL